VAILAIATGWLIWQDSEPEKAALQRETPKVFLDSVTQRQTQAPAETPLIKPVVDENVEPGQTKEVTGSTAPGKLMIYCSPWAAVYIDSVQVDTTPLTTPLRIRSGEHEVALIHPGFPAWREKITMKAEEERVITVHLDALYGFIMPLIHPWGEVYVDQIHQGQTPWAHPLALKIGEHQLRVTHPIMGELEETVTILPNDTLFYEMDLQRLVGKRK
jgi:hypothetical protein